MKRVHTLPLCVNIKRDAGAQLNFNREFHVDSIYQLLLQLIAYKNLGMDLLLRSEYQPALSFQLHYDPIIQIFGISRSSN
jgi:hypothetical protein